VRVNVPSTMTLPAASKAPMRCCPILSCLRSVLDPSGPQPPRCHPTRGTQERPARPPGDLSSVNQACRRGRLLAFRGGLATTPSTSCVRSRAGPRFPSRGVRSAGLDPGQPAHNQPYRACLPGASPPASAHRGPFGSPLSRSHSLWSGDPSQRTSSQAPACRIYTGALTAPVRVFGKYRPGLSMIPSRKSSAGGLAPRESGRERRNRT
jgi:hypothetical protein